MTKIAHIGHIPDVLKTLRQSTRTIHLRLHQHPITRHLMRKSLSLEQYLIALYAFDRYHEMIEREMQGFPQFGKSIRASNVIKQDCKKLTGESSNPLPPCPPLNLEAKADAALGLMYVTEGARQGGSAIAKNIAKTLTLNASNGAAFFNKNSDSLGADWDRFVSDLSSQCTNAAICCDAAISTFECLECYLWSVHQALPINLALPEPA